MLEELYIARPAETNEYPQWDAFTPYYKGDYVYLNGVIYAAIYESVFKLPSAYPLYWVVVDGGLEVIDKEIYVFGAKINREYKTAFFSDAKSVFSNSTKLINIPNTERNKAVLEYMEEADMNTKFPYKRHTCDYFFDGMQIIRNGEAIATGDFELQIVFGFNSKKYKGLIDKKLNDIKLSSAVLESDWIVKWDKINMYYLAGKYKYIDFISIDRTSDILIKNGVIQPKTNPPAPYIDNLKQMAIHPFILFNDILDLILLDDEYTKLNDKNFNLIPYEIFNPLKDRLDGLGLILGDNKDDLIESYTYTYTGQTHTAATYLLLPNNRTSPYNTSSGILDLFSIGFERYHTEKLLHESDDYEVVVEYDFEITNNISGLTLVKNGVEFVEFIYPYSDTNGYFRYKGITNIKHTGDFASYSFRFSSTYPTVTYADGGFITLTTTRKTSVFSLIPDVYTGRYNCLANLPEMTKMEFISAMMVIAGMFLTYDNNGDFKFIETSEIKDNINSNSVYDWSGRISNVRNSKYTFNSNAQNNLIKFDNYKSLSYNSVGVLTVEDDTLSVERDLYTMPFYLPEKISVGLAECSLYEQTCTTDGESPETKTFKNKCKHSSCFSVYNNRGIADLEVISPNTITRQETIDTLKVITDNSGNSSFGYNTADERWRYLKVGDVVHGILGVSRTITYMEKTSGYFVASPSFPASATTYIGSATITIPGGFIEQNYPIYQKLINRPIIKEVDVLLDFYESSQIDFTKPIYIKEWGKYCMLLELTAPNKGLCEAKLLLINQTL